MEVRSVKIPEAQSENPGKLAKGAGKSQETEPKSPPTPQKSFTNEGEEKGEEMVIVNCQFIK